MLTEILFYAGEKGEIGPIGATGKIGERGLPGAAGFGFTCSESPTASSLVASVTLPADTTFIRRASNKGSCPAGKILTSYSISFGKNYSEADAAKISIYLTNHQVGYKIGSSIVPGAGSFVASVGASDLNKEATITMTPFCCASSDQVSTVG